MRAFHTTMTATVKIVCCALTLFLLAEGSRTGQVWAQTQESTKKRTPTLTSEDVIPPKAESSDAKSASEKSSEASQSGSKVSPEESAWRDRVSAARDRAKATERAADDAEVRITTLRNQLSQSGQSPQDRNQINAELERVGIESKRLRLQAQDAANELKVLLAEGSQKGFKEAVGQNPTTDEGKPNEKYYRERFAQLSEERQTAERKVQLFEFRVRDLSQRITNNSGTGDNYYIGRLQQERKEAQQGLDEARAALTKAQSDLAALFTEARRAGIAPGIFRQ